MEISYMILGHKCPEQILLLVNALQSNDCFFYIHIDKKAALAPFSDIIQSDNVYFLNDDERVNCSWGDMSIVQATLNVLSCILKDNRNGYVVLLSGQDYPVKPTDEIKKYFYSNYPINFIDTFPLPTDNRWEDGGMKRIQEYTFNLSEAKGDFISVPSVFSATFYHHDTWKQLKKIASSPKGLSFIQKLFFKRKFPRNLHPYGGTQWWALTIPTIKKIMTFLQKNPNYISYHKYTHIPDEIFFHSIFMYLVRINSHLRMAPSVTYVNWNKTGAEQPAIFLRDDLNELVQLDAGKLFARKFDLQKDASIINQLDQYNTEKILVTGDELHLQH